MAKRIKWHMSSGEAKVGQPTNRVELVWLKEGELARVCYVETTGRGWGKTKQVKLLEPVIVVQVFSRDPHGWCTVLRNGHLETVYNCNLRPAAD